MVIFDRCEIKHTPLVLEGGASVTVCTSEVDREVNELSGTPETPVPMGAEELVPAGNGTTDEVDMLVAGMEVDGDADIEVGVTDVADTELGVADVDDAEVGAAGVEKGAGGANLEDEVKLDATPPAADPLEESSP